MKNKLTLKTVDQQDEKSAAELDAIYGGTHLLGGGGSGCISPDDSRWCCYKQGERINC